MGAGRVFDPCGGSRKLLSDDIGGKLMGNTNGLAQAAQYPPGELLPDPAFDRKRAAGAAIGSGPRGRLQATGGPPASR